MTVDTTQKTAGGLGLLQTAYFAPFSTLCSEDLYAFVEEGIARRRRDAVELEPFSRVSLRTYFGRFPAAYFQRWTSVARIIVEATVSGTGRLQVFASDMEDRERLMASSEFETRCETPLRFEVAIDKFLDGGFVWVDVESYGDSVVMRPVRYTVAETQRKPSTASVVVCTFNRAPECLATIEALATVAGAGTRLRDVFVVDQGSDAVEDQPGFAAVAERLGSALHYIRQPNLGGAGGFTRGMYESMGMVDRPDYVIFMDDDIVLEPETANRMAAFADHALEPLLVGGQMLYLYHPNLLHTSAEYARLDQLRAGIPVVDEAALDLTEQLPVEWVDAQYNAWWSCLIPTAVVDRVGYPLPLFFQWDDIEYGIRAGTHGVPTVTLPGAAVWHADFSMKDGDDWARYFSHRNSLIVAALHSDTVPKQAFRTLFKESLRFVLSMQYARAAMQLSAVDAFLAGPEQLHDGGASVAAWVRRMRADFSDTVRHTPAEIAKRQGLYGVPKHADRGTPSMPTAVFFKRLLYQLVRRNRGTAKIAAADNIWWHVSLFRSVIVTDAAQDAFRIRELDYRRSLATGWRALRTLLRLRRTGAVAARRWRAAFPELSSRDNWARLYAASD